MPSRLALRVGVPYSKERSRIVSAARRVSVDTVRPETWRASVIKVLLRITGLLATDSKSLGVEPSSGSLTVRGTRPKPAPIDVCYSKERQYVERLLRKIEQDGSRDAEWRTGILDDLRAAEALFLADEVRVRELLVLRSQARRQSRMVQDPAKVSGSGSGAVDKIAS